ncbi:hypothetical protein HMPREF2532_04901 [Bacteroides ovatus]|nr:hypothetical protein HMPREF2532_04901 [Bacteroides ovatus]
MCVLSAIYFSTKIIVLTPGCRTSFYCIKKLPHFLHGRRELLNKL